LYPLDIKHRKRGCSVSLSAQYDDLYASLTIFLLRDRLIERSEFGFASQRSSSVKRVAATQRQRVEERRQRFGVLIEQSRRLSRDGERTASSESSSATLRDVRLCDGSALESRCGGQHALQRARSSAAIAGKR
jgi:hypothetical protein